MLMIVSLFINASPRAIPNNPTTILDLGRF